MWNFVVPVAKAGATVNVTITSQDQLLEAAAHGLKQRVNDAHAGIKLSAFNGDQLAYQMAALDAAEQVAARINAGAFRGGGRGGFVPRPITAADVDAFLAAHPGYLASRDLSNAVAE